MPDNLPFRTTPEAVADALRELTRLYLEPDQTSTEARMAMQKAQLEARIALAFWDAEKAIEQHHAKRNARNTPRTNPR